MAPLFSQYVQAFEFCLPTTGTTVPVERNGDRVRLITRGGYDWTKRFPWIVEAALKSRDH